jgi:hypothetical protein
VAQERDNCQVILKQSNGASGSVKVGEFVDLLRSDTCIQNGCVSWSWRTYENLIAVNRGCSFPYHRNKMTHPIHSRNCPDIAINCEVINSRTRTHFLSGCRKSSVAEYRSAWEWQVRSLAHTHTHTRAYTCRNLL